MTKKTKFSPKIKHKVFTSFMVKLQDDDWMLGIFNPNDKTAAYFLAEPAVTNSSAKMTGSSKNKGSIISGYMISALSRQGMLETTIAGLPRKFKTVEDATEWLEGQVEQYDGDNIADFKATTPGQPLHDNYSDGNFYDQGKKYVPSTVEKTSESKFTDSDSVKKGNEIHDLLEEKFKKKTKAGAVKGKQGANKAKSATSQKNKFKTSKEELESLGLGWLFDE